MKKNIAFKCIELKGLNSEDIVIIPKEDNSKTFPKYLVANEDGTLDFIAIQANKESVKGDNTEALEKKISSLEQTVKSLAKTISALDSKINSMENSGTTAPKK